MDKKIEILNQLLEAEKAGVVTLSNLKKEFYYLIELPLDSMKEDEAWSTMGIVESLKREGGIPSKGIGNFAEKVNAQEGLDAKLNLLNKGQSWVVRKIDELLPMDLKKETSEFLYDMREKHLENIQTCQAFLDKPNRR